MSPPPSNDRKGRVGSESVPSLLTRVIGRDEALATLVNQVQDRRLITIVGPGGVGKSTVALALAGKLEGVFADGCVFVDLAPATDPALVPSALASVLGLSFSSDGPRGGLMHALKRKQVLLILDNCEHLADAVALLVETLLRSAPGVRVVATSREPLRAEGEWVSRLPALAFPDPASPVGAEAALAFSAVELFVERANACRQGFRLSDDDVPVVADLCRRLDGLPLALELAAARVDVFGLTELAARLDDRIRLMMKGRRTAPPRQQTLRGAMDWSLDTLSERQRLLFCAVAVFPSSFDVDATSAVLVDHQFSASDVFEELSVLAAKSLITADTSRERVSYRLLSTARAYALEKAEELRLLEGLQRRHALHALESLRRKTTESPAARVAPAVLEDIRAALKWAYGPGGDLPLAVALTVAAMPLAGSFSFHHEFRAYAARALDTLKRALPPDPMTEMRLLLALGGLSLHTEGPEAGDRYLSRAFELFDEHADLKDAMWINASDVLEGLWAVAFNAADYARNRDVAHKIIEMGGLSGSVGRSHNGERLLGMALHFSGAHAEARPYLERAFHHFASSGSWLQSNAVQMDLAVASGISLARTLWMQGEWRSSLDLLGQLLARATASQHAPTLCYTLGYLACPLALWRGDRAEATRLTGRLQQESTRHGLGLWRSWADCYASVEDSKPRSGDWNEMQREMLATLREDSGPELLERLESGFCGWCRPEVLRASAQSLLRRDGSRHEVETMLSRSLEEARAQAALFWELRTSISLAQLFYDSGETDRTRSLLDPIVARLPDDVAAVDFERARALLAEVS